jgi:hypothetical protein
MCFVRGVVECTSLVNSYRGVVVGLSFQNLESLTFSPRGQQ